MENLLVSWFQIKGFDNKALLREAKGLSILVGPWFQRCYF